MAQSYNTFIQYASPFVDILDRMAGTDIGGILTPTRGVGVNMTMASKGFYRGSGIFGLQTADAENMTAEFINHFKDP
jgi:hypothetical protein